MKTIASIIILFALTLQAAEYDIIVVQRKPDPNSTLNIQRLVPVTADSVLTFNASRLPETTPKTDFQMTGGVLDLTAYTGINGVVPTANLGTGGTGAGTKALFDDGTWKAIAGSGTVTSVSIVTANGVSGSVANSTTTPAITLTLGAITPSSVSASGAVSGSNLSGTNSGDVTVGTANGLSLLGQALSLGLASTSTTGALSSTDWNTFNGKQAAGSYITALTGDGTASGPGSSAFTLTTVNSNVGSFGGAGKRVAFTVNGKGLVTAASETLLSSSDVGLGSVTNNIQTKASIVPNTLPAAGAILVGNVLGSAYAPLTMSGHATLSSSGVLTLANTTVTAGSYTLASITVDAQGRITAASSGSGTGGDVTHSGTPVSGQVALWTASANIKGDPLLTFSGATLIVGDISNTSKLQVGNVVVFQSSGGATALTGISSISSTAESAIEASVDLDDLQGTLQGTKISTPVTGSYGLSNSTSTVDMYGATPPTAGQVPTATDATHATWQTPSTPTVPVKAFVNFDGGTADNLACTYSRTGTTVTVSSTAHGHIVGHVVFIDFTSGGALDGLYTIVSVPDANSYTITTAASGTIAAGSTMNENRRSIRSSGGVHSVTFAATGTFYVNFTTAFPDANYCCPGGVFWVTGNRGGGWVGVDSQGLTGVTAESCKVLAIGAGESVSTAIALNSGWCCLTFLR